MRRLYLLSDAQTIELLVMAQCSSSGKSGRSRDTAEVLAVMLD
jgi:hypothetical protein